MAERARVVDVRRGELKLLREIRDEADDPCEEPLHVARQRLELLRLLDLVRKLHELADEIRLLVGLANEPHAADALHEDAQRAVGDADHLVHDRGCADLVEIVEAGRIRVLVLHRDEREQPVAADDVVDQADRALLPDRERRHRLREDDGLLQRQDGQGRRQLVAELLGPLLLLRADDHLVLLVGQGRITSIGTVPEAGGRSAIGSVTLSIPRSKVAVERDGSISSPSSRRRLKAP